MSALSNVWEELDVNSAADIIGAQSTRVPKGFYERQITSFAKAEKVMFAKFSMSGVLKGVKINAAVQSFRNKAKELKVDLSITAVTKDKDGEMLELPFIILGKNESA